MPLDLRDVSTELVGAFMGFCFAMLLECLLREADARRRATTTMESLREELRLNRDISNQLVKGEAYPFPYRLDNWRSACAIGAVQEIGRLGESSGILHAFAALEQAAVIELSLFAAYQLHDDVRANERLDGLLEVVECSRRDVRDKIDAALVDGGRRRFWARR